ncbi:MAG: PIN domain-containing protein [Candidatus Electrothrix sp. LOE2]|nr:PIN domain-containing protein [Candidatus Electrothrix sp. LOE2]
MYLLDTNIFLEILLAQEKSAVCKKFLSENTAPLFMSDFSLHSIGVILFRHDKEQIFNAFLKDLIAEIDILSLTTESYPTLSGLKEKYNLDFDDSYQYKIAEENDLEIVTMDKDFRRVEEKIQIRFL